MHITMNSALTVAFKICLVAVFVKADNISLDGRIVGGENTSIEQHPYQLSLRRYSSHICGGSIFHNNFALTAAHCVNGLNAADFSIRIGSSQIYSGGTIVYVQSIYVHEKYNQTTMDNDIAILKLKTAITFSKSILPVALPSQGRILNHGVYSTVTGWGYKEESGRVSEILQKVQVPVVANSICKTKYPEEDLNNNMICAGYIGTGGKDACQGDSGGPLFADGFLMGITSWGYGCARPHYPGVYTRVSMYRNWIKSKTNY